MKMLLIIAIASVSTSCIDTNELDWEKAPRTHECSEAEHLRVLNEADGCKRVSTWSPNYCYGSSMIRICRVRK